MDELLQSLDQAAVSRQLTININLSGVSAEAENSIKNAVYSAVRLGVKDAYLSHIAPDLQDRNVLPPVVS